ncbi:MAG: hypothetical protein IH830_04535 [Planctomycetes bacterium]|nr:hypothetical protein [Planctomycetota bacterium]
MAYKEIRYTYWEYRNLPIGRDSPDCIIHQWLKKAVLERNEHILLLRFARRKWFSRTSPSGPTECEISTRADARASRSMSYRDRTPPFLVTAPQFDQEVLDQHFDATSRGTMDRESAFRVFRLSEKESLPVLEAIRTYHPHVSIGHDASWIVTFEYL